MSSKSPAYQANALWQKQPKVNAELFALTYGALVGELLHDIEAPAKITEELDRMGHSMGVRCIEEFLAKSESIKTQSFSETADLVKMAFKMFLGVLPEISSGDTDASYRVVFHDNPLALFVELPEGNQELEYNQLLAGMVRGMLEMLQFDVNAKIVQSQLRGDEVNELVVDLKQVLQEGAGEEYQDE